VLELLRRENRIIHGAGLYQEARSENDHVVASANGWGCVGTKIGNMQVVSQRGGYGSTIVPKAQNTQARESQGTAPGQAFAAKSKKSLRHRKTATEGISRRRECVFSDTATVKDDGPAVFVPRFLLSGQISSCTPGLQVLRIDVRSLFWRDAMAAMWAGSV